MRLRGAFFIALTALTLTAPFAAKAYDLAGMRSTQNQPQTSTATLAGTTSYQGRIVHDVRFEGVETDNREKLLALIAQKPGQPLDRDLIRESIQALHATGRFADVRVEGDLLPDGQVALVFVTSPNYFIGDITAEGTPNRPTPNQVVNASKLQLGELFTSDKSERALKNIKQLFEENGYYQSTTTQEEKKHQDTQQIDIVFRIVPGPQARVGQMAITGNPDLPNAQILEIAKMHPGDLVTVGRITRALDRLRKKFQKQKQLTAQVSISSRLYRPEANSVDFTFKIEPGPRVEIVAEGYKISNGVLKRNVPVYEENAVDDDLLNEGRRNLLNYMQTRGYFDATVTMKKQPDPTGNTMRVVYTIHEGSRHKLLKIEIVGNKSFPEDLILSRMQVKPSGRLFSHGLYNEGLLNDDVGNLAEDPYRANGFLQVKITPEVEDDYQGHENELAIILRIEEGPQTLVGAMKILGNQTFTEEQFPSLNIAVSQPFSESSVSQDREIILNFYSNRGFPNATFEATAQPAPGQANRMDITYTIKEGERFFVDQVLVSGLNFTRPSVVRHQLKVQAGAPLSQLAMLKTEQNLYDLGIFSQVDTAVQNPDGTEKDKNVLVAMQEAKRYTFNYGVGLEFQTGQPSVGTNQPQGETGVSPRVSFAVTRLNFRGYAHTLTFKGNVGRLQQRALIGYEAPRLLNSDNWRLSMAIFYDNTLDVTTFTSERLEGSVQFSQTLSKASTMLYRFTYRKVRASNIEVSPDQVPLLSQPTRVGIPAFSYIRDKRDNPVETTKGNYTTFDGGVASGYFGSEADFSRVLIQNSTYHAFGSNRPVGKKFVFARSTRIGLETPFANTIMPQPGQICPASGNPECMPLPERFFTGGGNSHRGFGLNQAGPRDPQSGFPLGGTALFLNSEELRLPPTTLPFVGDNVSFTIFHDAGNVFTTGNEMVHNLLRWRQKDPQLCMQEITHTQCDYSYISHAIGVGVHYRTPIGPVRFDFGYNLNPPAFPSCQATPGFTGQGVSASCTTSTPYFVPQHARHFNVFFSIGQAF